MSHNCFSYCLICFTSLPLLPYLFYIAPLLALFVLHRFANWHYLFYIASLIGTICFTSLRYWHYLFYVASLLALFVFTSLRYLALFV
jgi:hypothetical protein